MTTFNHVFLRLCGYFILMVALAIPFISQAFFPIIIPIPFGDDDGTPTEVSVTNPDFTFLYTQDSFEFNEVQTHAEAQSIYNLLLATPVVRESGSTIIIGPTGGYHIVLSGLNASQRAQVMPYFESAQSLTITSYVNGMGVLRYRVQALLEIEAPSGGFAMSLYSSQVLAFENQPFSLRWGIAYTNPPTCQLRSSGPTSVTLPSGAALTTYGSTTLRIATEGDYSFTYDCTSNGVRQVRSVVVTVVPTDVEFDASVSGPACFIGPNDSFCEGYISWDSYVQNGTVESITLRNMTTQALVTTDPRGLNHPVQLRYGTSTFLLVMVTRDSRGRLSTTTATTVGTAVCAAGMVWNGTICVPNTASGGWDIISDFDSYGRGYAGMPGRNGGNLHHPENIMCEAVRFWVCDVRDGQPPVQIEIFVDDELVLTDRTNIYAPVDVLVNPWWEGLSRYHHTPGCGMSDHLTYGYRYYIPEYLKDEEVHNLKIKATRADGVSRWVTFNGWNAYSNYPNTMYQNFPFQCSPTQVTVVTDLAAYLAFPSMATSGLPIAVTEARVMNLGTLDLATSTQAVLQFDYGADGMGGTNDFSLRADIMTLQSGDTVYPDFGQVTFPVSGNWRVRVAIDLSNVVDPVDMRGNNYSVWRNVTVRAGTGLPAATLTATNCVIPVGESSCESTVAWTSSNFGGTTEVLQGGTVFSTARSNVSGVTREVSVSERSFTIRDAGGSYTRSVVPRVECDGVSHWVGGVCTLDDGLLPPELQIVADRQVVRSGETATVEISVTADYPVNCQVTGLGRGPESFVHAGTGTTVESITTSPLVSKQVVTVTCSSLGYPAVTESTTIDVIPQQYEI